MIMSHTDRCHWKRPYHCVSALALRAALARSSWAANTQEVERKKPSAYEVPLSIQLLRDHEILTKEAKQSSGGPWCRCRHCARLSMPRWIGWPHNKPPPQSDNSDNIAMINTNNNANSNWLDCSLHDIEEGAKWTKTEDDNLRDAV
jgi:hypothetical protein